MTSQPLHDGQLEHSEDEYVLNAAQMEFMINIEAAADGAGHQDDYEFFDDLVASDEWQLVFGDINWD